MSRLLQPLLWKGVATCIKNQGFMSSGMLLLRRQCTVVEAVTHGEKRIAEKITSNLNVSKIQVEDISGGCGSMYRIFVASDDFTGKRTIQQHRIINDILKDEVKDMHGLTIETSVS